MWAHHGIYTSEDNVGLWHSGKDRGCLVVSHVVLRAVRGVDQKILSLVTSKCRLSVVALHLLVLDSVSLSLSKNERMLEHKGSWHRGLLNLCCWPVFVVARWCRWASLSDTTGLDFC